MVSIESVHVELPPYKVTKEDLKDVAAIWLKENGDLAEKFLRIASNSGVENRSLILPYRDILNLQGLSERAKIFEELGEQILLKAVDSCLANSGYRGNDFSHLIFTSCSAPVIPSVDASVILKSSLSGDIKRIPIFQHGCIGGVVGLSLGHQLANQGKCVLLASLELCSLLYHFNDKAGAQLLGAAIFSDGAAVTIISPRKGRLNFIDSMSYLIPDSRHLMGYNLYDDGLHLRLERELPSILSKETPEALSMFLAKNNIALNEVNYFLFHPGGKKILDCFEEDLGLRPDQYHWSRDVLRDHGNMSSATIHFVLEKFMKEVPLNSGENVVIVGIGPGLSLEFILMKGGSK